MHLRVSYKPGFQVGQEVEVEVHLPSPYRAVVVLFVLPTAALVLGAALGAAWKTILPGAPNMRCALFAFGAMAAVYAIGTLWHRRTQRDVPPPEIVGIASDEDQSDPTQNAEG